MRGHGARPFDDTSLRRCSVPLQFYIPSERPSSLSTSHSREGARQEAGGTGTGQRSSALSSNDIS